MMPALVLLAYEAEDVKPGWVALLLVLGLAVATYLLWRSMNNQLRKIQLPPRGTHPVDASPSDGDGDETTDPPAR